MFEMDTSGFSIRLHNTETRQKENFEPLKNGQVTIYTCGPTVYDFAHIGNFRTYVFEDLLRRTFQFLGYKVTQAMNITDVDDKTIKGANAKKVPLKEYTQQYEDAFFEDLRTLNIQQVEHYPAATQHIPEMVEVIERLLEEGIAYRGGDGSIYYAIEKFPQYGRLSRLNLAELQAGASERVASDEYDKDNVADFVLWKSFNAERDGNIFWESPFGPGRPGWHLECSAMAMKLLGATIDIHCGGVDNIFPHHENEIAQSEAYSGQRFVNMWLHSEHLIVDGKKMSKSLGNFYTLRDLLSSGYSGTQVRYMLLHTHYRTQLNFTMEGLDAVKASLQRLNDFIQRMQEIAGGTPGDDVKPILQRTFTRFSEALADDLNTSAALAAVFDMVHDINVLCDDHKVAEQEAQEVLKLLQRFDQVLGILSFDRDEETVPSEVLKLLERRQQARKDKDWALADQLRDEILSSGYLIEDTPSGARLKPKNLSR